MNTSAWMRLSVLVAAALAAPACFVDPVDFSGKACTAASDCPDGYRCDPALDVCVKPGAGLDATSPGDAALPRDGSITSDGSLGSDGALLDDAGTEPADADVVEPRDAGRPRDASTPNRDAGAKPDATVVSPPDAGTGCSLDSDCKTLGAFFCGPAKTCLPCDTDQKCGPSCSACGAFTSCDGTSCQPCNTDLKCGAECTACTPGTTCSGSSCMPCTTDQKCGPTCSPCGPGTFCSRNVFGQVACAACTTADHCGAGCVACSDPVPVCGASGCVQCIQSTDCPPIAGTARYCDDANTCQVCKTSEHCGPGCIACSPRQPVCDGLQCVECLVDADCATSLGGPACCNNRCIKAQVPKLAGFLPLSASPGSTVDLTLYGSNFNECSQVLVDGVPATVTWSGDPAKMVAHLQVPVIAGGHPVVVRNLGPGGGDSNPNDWSLGPDLAVGQTTGVAYVPGTDLVAISSSDRSALELFDPALPGPAVATLSLSGLPPAYLAAGTQKLLVTTRNSSELRIYDNLPNPTYATVFVSGPAALLDVDDTTSLALVANSNPDEFDVLDLTNPSYSSVFSMPVTGAPCCELYAVGLDGAFHDSPFLSYNSGAGIPRAPFMFDEVNSSPARYPFAMNRPQHEVVALRNTMAEGYLLPSGNVQGSMPVPTTGTLAMNVTSFGARVLLLPPRNGSGALHVMDWGKKSTLGDVGTPRSRYCSSAGKDQGAPDAVAIDPTRNRAFVTNSCMKTLEGYNLNILFVR
ncbi:MAG: hypothetical protein QM765_20545 [Myxococcales bacterium]